MQILDQRTPEDISIERFEKRRKMGHGVGLGADYKPAWWAYQVSSHGNKHVCTSPFNGRVMGFYSTLEYHVFRKLLRSIPRPTDIREQVFLDLEETIRLCAEQGIRHPKIPGTKDYHPFTTDLFADYDSGTTTISQPIHIKPKALLSKPRNKEKREVEAAYWAKRGQVLQVITEDYIPQNEWLNIYWFHEQRADISEIDDSTLEKIADSLLPELRRPTMLCAAAKRVASHLGIAQGTVITAARFILSLIDVETTDGQPIYRSKGLFIGGQL